MRFLVDECVGPSVVRWLRENNHDATSAYEDCRGWEDESILEKAYSEGRIVVTMDKDFGEKGLSNENASLRHYTASQRILRPGQKDLFDEKGPFPLGIGFIWPLRSGNRDCDQDIRSYHRLVVYLFN
jgi:hypothetical protein